MDCDSPQIQICSINQLLPDSHPEANLSAVIFFWLLHFFSRDGMWVTVLAVGKNILLSAAITLIALLFLIPYTAIAAENEELVFGMSATFTGANGELGIEFYRGFMSYLDQINAKGGINGRTIRVLPANDGYNPAPCFKNTLRFIKDDKVFALFSYVGTPTSSYILPLLQKFESENIYLLFPFTGAHPLRSEPFGRFVFNLRASYFDETAALVDNFIKIGRPRIAVFYQSDAYGRNGWDGVRRALNRHGLPIAGEAAYRRGAPFEQDFSREVGHLMSSNPDAIIVIGTYASQGAFIRDARNAGYNLPIAGVSFADSDKMLEMLMQAGRASGRDYTANLVNTQVVPDYTDQSLPGVRLYRQAMDAYKGMPVTKAAGYTPRRFSFVSFEGFLNGMLLAEMVKRMGDNPERRRIPEIMETIEDFDLGIGVKVNFGHDRHQGLDEVYLTTVINGHFQSIDTLERWRR